jgi:hypothetical protein
MSSWVDNAGFYAAIDTNKMIERLIERAYSGAQTESASHQQGFYNIIDFNKVQERLKIDLVVKQ